MIYIYIYIYIYRPPPPRPDGGWEAQTPYLEAETVTKQYQSQRAPLCAHLCGALINKKEAMSSELVFGSVPAAECCEGESNVCRPPFCFPTKHSLRELIKIWGCCAGGVSDVWAVATPCVGTG